MSTERGFTLVEVLVALTITAVALVGALRASATLTQSAIDLRLRAYALWSAENRLAQVRLAAEWPNPGRREYECPQGGIALRCTETVAATPNPFFRRVEIAVARVDARAEEQLVRLVGFAISPGGSGQGGQ